MSFLNKFKYHYHLKHIDNLFLDQKYQEIFEYLGQMKNDEKLFYELSLKYISNSINNFNQDILSKKIVWINTFLDDDSEYLRFFIQDYFKNFENLKQDIKSYKQEIDQIIQSNEDINFNTLVNQSYFFQWMILNKYDMLRVTEEEENIGQDIYEMGSSAYNIENHPLKENKICKK